MRMGIVPVENGEYEIEGILITGRWRRNTGMRKMTTEDDHDMATITVMPISNQERGFRGRC